MRRWPTEEVCLSIAVGLVAFGLTHIHLRIELPICHVQDAVRAKRP